MREVGQAPPAERVTSEGERTRARILQAGIACFAERGFSGATTRAVAGAAGVNVATLAYHFGGKEGLYRAAIDALYAHLAQVELPPPASLGSDPAERIETLVRLLYRFSRAHLNEVRLLLRHVLETGNLPGPVRDEWAGALLEQGRALGEELLGLRLAPDWRLQLLTLNHLVVRYAISADEDLAPFVSDPDPHRAVEDHLVAVARRLLLPG